MVIQGNGNDALLDDRHDGLLAPERQRRFIADIPHSAGICANMHAQSRRKRAIFLLDGGLHWTGGNEAAEWMIASGWWRGRKGCRLEIAHPLSRKGWHSAQKQMEAGQPASHVIPVHDPAGRLVGLATLQAYGAHAQEDMPAYMLFVRALHADDANDVAIHLQRMFGLTVREAALATALRRDGGLAAAASALNISSGSARTRLQTVFEKTGTHKQSELLRMLEALAEMTT